jgi:twinkle protein
VQIAPYYDADGNMVAQKIRFADKTFAWLGDPKTALPFGANRFPKAGRMIVVTEGEIDALAMSQVQDNRFPVVSIACGADNPTDRDGNPLPLNKIRKYAATHREYFRNFEKVIIMFDSDEQGRASARAFAEVIGPTARIAELPEHDAADMLKAGKTEQLI